MGLEIPKPYVGCLETTERSWPKCHKCSEKMGVLYPVEVCGIVATERPTALRMRWKIVLEVECHDMVQRMVVESARWAGTANDWDRIGDTFAFVKGEGGRWKCEVIPPGWREMHKPLKLWR